MKFTQFLKTKGAIASIFMGIFYAVAMLGIFIPGYSAIPNNVDQMPIAMVNDDTGQYGTMISEQLAEKLPFKEIETGLTNKQATEQLEKNMLALVIHIPETFSADMQNGETSSSIDFKTNGASSTVVSSTMTSIVNQINTQLSNQLSTQSAQGVLMNLNIPEAQATEMAEMIETAYVGNMVTINEVPAGMHNNMLPMFLTMAGYTGAMIGAMQLVAAFRESRGKASKTRLFLYVQLTALLIAVVSSVIGVSVAYLVSSHGAEMFAGLAAQQVLNYMVCFNFTAITIFLLGEGGMVLNLPILLIQTLANGATMPREMMYLPYEWMSYISPMYYSVQAYMANLYGSVSAEPFQVMMATIGGAALIINILIVALFHKPVPVAETEAKTETVPASAEITV
ncbi:YhgE/Pip domain-containing protein [Planococcus glaciei]|uniref:YhgE/Pip domain-containing protein n=1 Tax=Planococcus glaciei TaxID=459472 RepID=UPI001C73DA21|nr:ABC transporter permease [Planococcus glaciei]MBX0315986.1 ABC transporter permease [Planococcus glaciei]